MAIYRNKNDDTIFYGGEFKLKVSMDAIDEQHMEDVDFFCTFKAGGKVVIVQKSRMIKVDACMIGFLENCSIIEVQAALC